MSYDTWKCTAPADEEPDLEACGHRVGTCEGECMVEEDEMAPKLAMMLEMIRAQLGPAAEGYLVEVLRRDWAVRALDAWVAEWADYDFVREHMTMSGHGDSPQAGQWLCTIKESEDESETYYWGPTPDAARLAAAQAVFGSLSESTRTELGECP